MKLFLLLFAKCLLAGTLYQHSATPWVDVYLDSFVSGGEIPGAPSPQYSVSASVASTDSLATAYVIRVTVLLADGSTFSAGALVERSASPYTYVSFPIPGGAVPARLIRLDITRLHQEPNDVIR